MTEVSTPRDEIPPDVLHEHLSRKSSTGAPDTLARDEETERARTNLAETTSSDSAVRRTGETLPIGEVLDTESESRTPELAIDVEDFRELYFHGVKRRDQRGLDLKVPKGIIYGLIGKDSCGLTRLLEYITGLARCPGPGVGYATSLTRDFSDWELTVREYLHFFGKIYGMSETSIRDRIRILSELFSLPGDTHLLGDLNVDEEHLVSLAAGLIHSPAVLVLVDALFSSNSIVRMRIWSNLRRLTREEGLTILLGCSDFGALESQSDRVGIMCSGRIVAEGPPRLLLDEFKADTLAEVFLQLTLADEEKPLINESQLNELLGTETRNQDGQNSEMNPTSDMESALSLDPTRATVQRGIPHKSPGRLLMLTKMNLILLTRGHGFFLKRLLTLLFVFYALAGATLVFCHQAIASEKALNVSRDLSGDISNISTASPGYTLEPDREPSASESMLCGLMFSLIFGMGLAAGTIGRNFRIDTHLCYVSVGARSCEVIRASILTHMFVMLILEAFLLVPVFACFRSSDSIHSESVALIIVLCYLQGVQGMLISDIFADAQRSFFGVPFLPLIFFMNTCCNGTTVLLDEIFPIICRLLQVMMPQRLPGEALQCIIFRGWGIEYYDVWAGILASIAWSSGCALLAIAELYGQLIH